MRRCCFLVVALSSFLRGVKVGFVCGARFLAVPFLGLPVALLDRGCAVGEDCVAGACSAAKWFFPVPVCFMRFRFSHDLGFLFC